VDADIAAAESAQRGRLLAPEATDLQYGAVQALVRHGAERVDVGDRGVGVAQPVLILDTEPGVVELCFKPGTGIGVELAVHAFPRSVRLSCFTRTTPRSGQQRGRRARYPAQAAPGAPRRLWRQSSSRLRSRPSSSMTGRT